MDCELQRCGESELGSEPDEESHVRTGTESRAEAQHEEILNCDQINLHFLCLHSAALSLALSLCRAVSRSLAPPPSVIVWQKYKQRSTPPCQRSTHDPESVRNTVYKLKQLQSFTLFQHLLCCIWLPWQPLRRRAAQALMLPLLAWLVSQLCWRLGLINM